MTSVEDAAITPLRYSDADIPALIDIWAGVAAALIDIGRACSADEWAAATPCPGWTVGDLVAHLIGIERRMLGEPPPDHVPDWGALPHAQGPVGRFTELDIDLRRSWPAASVIAEAEETVARRLEMLQAGPQDLGVEVMGVFGRAVPIEYMLALRTFDGWAHGQDARTALGRPGDWAGAGGWISAGRMCAALPFIIAKNMQCAPGTIATIDVTPVDHDSVSFDRTVVIDDDGRGNFASVYSSSTPTFAIRCDWGTFSQLACGRLDIHSDDVRRRVDVRGDQELGDRFIEELAITP